MIPRAKLIHQLDHRVRIRISGVGKNKKEFFALLRKKLAEKFNFQTLLVNPVTGSAVLQDQNLDFVSVAHYAEAEHLFVMDEEKHQASNLVAGSAKKQFTRLNKSILALTGHRLDVSSSVFLVLIVHTIREIVRGNLAGPSWFTALWFASTIYNRDFIGYGGDPGHGCGDHDSGDAHA